MKGILYIIAAPSGTGKTSLVKALVKSRNNLKVSVSHTTREPRPHEVDGVDYNFITTANFEKMLDNAELLEHAKVFDNFYGTSSDWVHTNLTAGFDVILEIDWQGAKQIRAKIQDAVSIFILPPSFRTLRERLTQRETCPNIIQQRLNGAAADISHYLEFDYLLVNDNFDKTLGELQSIVTSARLRTQFSQQELNNIISDLRQIRN